MSREDAPKRRIEFVYGKTDGLFHFWPSLFWSFGDGIALSWLRWAVGVSWKIDIRRKK